VPEADKAALYTGAAVVCYPGLWEGFGLPVLEAMAQGTPAVTSAGTATAEAAGDAALLVDPLDTDAIAAAIGRVLEDRALAERLAAAGRDRAAQLTWERSADLVAAALRDVVSETVGAPDR
jgi:glycosyltransferase involved in cell wall biosynthesis